LIETLIYLAAAVVCVSVAKRAGLGSVLGYLIAGCAIGPWGMSLVREADSTSHIAEFGVVLMLFLIGLELDLKRLVALRGPVFIGGGVQMAFSGALLAAAFALAGLPWHAALVAGLAVAMSSTAISVQTMTERNLLGSPAGRVGFGILLFQDIAAIPLIALVPLLGTQAVGAEPGWVRASKAIGAIAGVIVMGRFLTRPIMQLIARTEVREIFTAFALLLVIGIAQLMTLADLSMAMGAFIAGVLLASSEYRHALEADIAPFKGLLLGLFFISVGMSIDLSLVVARPLALAAAVAAILAIKGIVLAAMATRSGIGRQQRWLFAAMLAQAGEFAFVVLGVARDAGVMTPDAQALLNAAVALSMAATPVLVVLCDRLAVSVARADRPADAIEEHGAQVIVAGFGRYGQIVARMLLAHQVPITVLDHDPDQIETLRKFGYKVYYGDATRLDLLEAAGAAKAKTLVVAIDDVEDSLSLVDVARAAFPDLKIVARARNVRHYLELLDRGVDTIERETFESALRTGREALQSLGMEPYEAREFAEVFRRRNLATLAAMVPHFRDETKRVAIAKSGVQELEENLRRDREGRAQDSSKEGWF